MSSLEIRKDTEGHYEITDGQASYPISELHQVDYGLMARLFNVTPHDVFMGLLKCPDYSQGATAKNDFLPEDKFEVKLLADRIMSIEVFKTSISSKEIYVWRDGYYQPVGEVEIEKLVVSFLQKEFKKSFLSEVTEYIRGSTFTEFEEPPANLINLENGIYDIETRALTPHDPKYHFFQKIPVKYEKEATCPNIIKFLGEITANEEDIQILLERIGYCLYRSNPFSKILILQGEGANGKTTYINMLIAFLGRENVSNRSLQELEYDRFAKVSLFGKLANVYDDLTDDAVEHTGILKQLSGNSPIEASQKFKGPINFYNYAKQIYSANRLPQINEDTFALWRRFDIITFPNQFDGEKCDPKLIEKLTTKEELSGLLNIALIALNGILANGKMSFSKTMEETKDDYARKSNPLEAFCLDCLIEDSVESIVKQDLFNLFTAYCRKMKLTSVTSNTFFKNLPQYVSVFDCKVGPEGKQKTAFKGIKLSEDGEKLKISIISTISTLFPTLDKVQSSTNNKVEKTLDILDRVDRKEVSS